MLKEFAEVLEQTIIKTVTQGYFTKDIAKLMEGQDKVERSKYLNTFEFIEKVALRFQQRMVEGDVEDLESISIQINDT